MQARICIGNVRDWDSHSCSHTLLCSMTLIPMPSILGNRSTEVGTNNEAQFEGSRFCRSRTRQETRLVDLHRHYRYLGVCLLSGRGANKQFRIRHVYGIRVPLHHTLCLDRQDAWRRPCFLLVECPGLLRINEAEVAYLGKHLHEKASSADWSNNLIETKRKITNFDLNIKRNLSLTGAEAKIS